jgi:hypothetical protein
MSWRDHSEGEESERKRCSFTMTCDSERVLSMTIIGVRVDGELLRLYFIDRR